MARTSARSEKTQWAELGAATRLAQLDRERAAIMKAFPRLKRGPQTAVVLSDRPRRKMSAKARRAMSEGMRRFWARRKAAAKAKPSA